MRHVVEYGLSPCAVPGTQPRLACSLDTPDDDHRHGQDP